MAEPASPLDIAGMIGGILSLLAAAGAAVKFLFRRSDRREAALDEKEAEFVGELKQAIQQQGERIEALELDNRKMWLVIGYVVPALHAHDPNSPALKAAARLLGDAFPIDFNTPPDMSATLDKI